MIIFSCRDIEKRVKHGIKLKVLMIFFVLIAKIFTAAHNMLTTRSGSSSLFGEVSNIDRINIVGALLYELVVLINYLNK